MTLPTWRLLDVAHYWLILTTPDQEQQRELNERLTGPLSHQHRNAPVQRAPGIRPPTWWKGDAYATQSSLAAASELRHRG